MVPTVNEEAEIRACLGSLEGSPVPFEILVVDGGSEDRTRSLAEQAGARVIDAPRGRARQMNRGAELAEGEVLLFLHADLRLPPGALVAVERALREPEVAGGGFFKRYSPSTPLLDGIAWVQNHLRAGWFKDLVGTHAIFVRREVFEALGGYPDLPLLEDVVLSDRLKQVGRVEVLREAVTVSSRKYRRDGTMRRILRNLWIMFQFRILGVSPEVLLEQYRRN